MQLFTYSILSWAIPAGGILVILAYAFILWMLGDRARAREHMVTAFMVAMTIIAIGGAYVLGNLVIKSVSNQSISIDDAWSVNTLNDTADRFDKIYRKAVDWVVYIRAVQASTGLIPVVGYPISQAVQASTFWQNRVFTFASTTFLALEWFTMILMYLHPWLLLFGAGLASLPRFRAIGGVLLSIYLVMGATVVLLSYYAYNYIFYPGSIVYKAPSAKDIASNPICYGISSVGGVTSIASDADGAANLFMKATMLAIVVTLLAGVLTAGISRIFEGIPVMFRPI